MATGIDVTIRGANQLEQLARAVKLYGGKELRKEMLRGLRTAAKPLVNDLRESARDTLPASGGLAELVATSKIAPRTRTAGKSAGVRVVGTGTTVHDIEATNAGHLRHPVYGNTNNWVTQDIEAGWWDEGGREAAPLVRVALLVVMNDIAHKITRSV